jgi:phosphate transport system ATP-binding protein
MTETATPTDEAPSTTEAHGSTDGSSTNGTAELAIAEPLPMHEDHAQAPAPVLAAAEDSSAAAVAMEAHAHDEVTAVDAALDPIIRLENVSFYYGAFRAVKDVSIAFTPKQITALIGPSGCGKSTLLRTINRMNDLIPGTRVEGGVLYHGIDLYGKDVDAVEVRRRIGMVFQKPNPFPKSIYDNIAFGPRINGMKGNMDEIVEDSLRRAALWDDVKDKLKQSGLALSGGQQQRLCIARAIATSPDVILMDEPCSALDPRSTLQIEELMFELKQNYTIVIVTHNMQQAARASDHTVFLNMADDRAGYVVEEGPTLGIFTNPKDQMTEDYVSGRFG